MTAFAPVTRAASLISVVVPCYNEEAVIDATHRRLQSVLQSQLSIPFEIVYVNDGSSDNTPTLLRRIAEDCEHVNAISFSRNFGHQLAATAGIDVARGDAVILIDADLQDPPEVIPQMIAMWRDGADVVYGVRAARAGESPFKRATAALFYRILSRVSEVPIPLDTGDFRLMDRNVVEVLKRMPERDRFLRGMVAWAGFRQEPLLYARDPRLAGESKYPLTKMLRFAVDGISSFSTRPLRLATWFGFLSAGIAFLGILYALAARLLTDSWVPGWAAIFVAITFLGGIQLVALGIIGEYVGRLFVQVKARPLYVIQERWGRSTPNALDSGSDATSIGPPQ